MTESPAVSVLVTVYNREAYLAAYLESILASSWEDFEVVVVDDGFADGSAAIAAEYASRDPRVRFYQNDRNLPCCHLGWHGGGVTSNRSSSGTMRTCSTSRKVTRLPWTL
jgi:cellulose synthase/poly-beta-1,6-N-acetylglucosamine synthase-like glycosyltransferase